MRSDAWAKFVMEYDPELYRCGVQNRLFFDDATTVAKNFAEWVASSFEKARDHDVVFNSEIVDSARSHFGERVSGRLVIPAFRAVTKAKQVRLHRGRGFKGWAVRS